jgi:transposase-like protein
MVDLKRVYRAVSKAAAETALDDLDERWGQKYPIVIKSWRNKWENLSVYFKYPEEIRRVIYTTNSIEAVHRQFRKLTKTKGGFPNENSLLKLLYMGIQNASKKWTMPIQNWNLASAHFPLTTMTSADFSTPFPVSRPPSVRWISLYLVSVRQYRYRSGFWWCLASFVRE